MTDDRSSGAARPDRPGTRRPTPDPTRPGTVYRSGPTLRRRRPAGPAQPSPGQPGPAQPSSAQPGPAQPGPAQPGPAQPGPGGTSIYRSGPGLRAPGDHGAPAAPARPSATPPGGPAGPAGPTGLGPGRRRRRRRLRRGVIALVVLALLAYPVALGAVAWTHLGKVAALPAADSLANTPGRTFLIVGSDSRQQLTDAEAQQLGTGTKAIAGQRTDTIMLLHVPAGGGPTVLVSVPRDSYVAIPGHGHNKINAAYAYGGAPLLIKTLEQASGVRIDEYVETGLGGYATLVDAIGGVRVCSPRAIKDAKAHLDIPQGCQQMDGKTALGYARARYSDPRGDLGRVERQRQVLAAIAAKTLSPSTLLLPWRAFGAAAAGGDALVVDDGTTPLGLYRFVMAMRAVAGGNGVSLTVPVSDPNATRGGQSVVLWDKAKAASLFTALKKDDTSAVRSLAG